MKKIHSLLLASAALAALSCAKETASEPVLSKITFHVNAEEAIDPAATRAVFSNGAVSFAANDQISVFDGVGNQPFTTTEGGAAAEFSGSAATAAVYNILSPYQADATCAGNVITATVPKVQTAVKDGVDPAALVAVARTTSTGEIHLKNVVGLLKVEVNTGGSVREIQVAAGNALNVAIAGKIAITTPSTPDGTPTYTLADTTPEGKVTCVTLVPPSGQNFLAVGTYYIAVLNKTYDNLTVAYVTNEKQLRARKGSAEAVVGRSKILNLGALGNGYGAGYSNISTTGNAILQAGETVNLLLKKMATPSITAVSQDETTITRIELKVNTLDGAAASQTIHVSGAADRYPIYAILRGTVLTIYTKGNKINLGGAGGGNVLFRNFAAVESINAEVLAAGNATSITRLFANCPMLEEIDLTGMSTTNITSMVRVFEGCAGLKRINLTGWNTEKVSGTAADTGFYMMFSNCLKLENLKLGDAFLPVDGVKVTGMFSNAARDRDNSSTVQAKIYCSDAMWAWLNTNLNANGVNEDTGFNKFRFVHPTE